MGRDDTNPVRIVETEAGRLRGRVDRVARAVVWTLDCPGCGEELPLTEEMFTGHEGANCGCGWKSPVYSPLAEGDQPRYYDYAATFETVPGQTAAA